MRKHNAENELAKREYLAWLRNAGGRSTATLDMVAAALHRFETYNHYKGFKAFRREQAISFKAHLAEQINEATGKPLSKATLYSTLKVLRAFFEWLSREPGYRKAIQFSDAAYFNVTDNEARIATASRQRPSPSLEQVKHVLTTMPVGTAVERRDRALIALILLTGARDGAAASLRLKHIDIGARTLFQDAREVKTKRAKTQKTAFFPVGVEIERVVIEWVDELSKQHLFGPDDPLFPATRRALDGAGLFSSAGLDRKVWTTAAPIRAIFRSAYGRAGLPYYNPHALRRTIMQLGYDLNLSPRELKAWSQNLGHDSVLTSLNSYGALQFEEQAAVIAEIGARETAPDADVENLVRQLAVQLVRRRVG